MFQNTVACAHDQILQILLHPTDQISQRSVSQSVGQSLIEGAALGLYLAPSRIVLSFILWHLISRRRFPRLCVHRSCSTRRRGSGLLQHQGESLGVPACLDVAEVRRGTQRGLSDNGGGGRWRRRWQLFTERGGGKSEREREVLSGIHTHTHRHTPEGRCPVLPTAPAGAPHSAHVPHLVSCTARHMQTGNIAMMDGPFMSRRGGGCCCQVVWLCTGNTDQHAEGSKPEEGSKLTPAPRQESPSTHSALQCPLSSGSASSWPACQRSRRQTLCRCEQRHGQQQHRSNTQRSVAAALQVG